MGCPAPHITQQMAGGALLQHSFDLTKEDAIKSYNKMFYAYLRTFTRLELKALPQLGSRNNLGDQ